MCTSCHTDVVVAPIVAQPTGREYAVGGMTCGTCAGRVSTAVQAVDGVTDVRVDVAGGRIHVTGPATDLDIEAAVTAAGYTLTPA